MQPRFTIAVVLACLTLAGCSTVQPKPKPSSPWVFQTPKPHGAIYRFFHPKNERMWKGVSPALREKVEAVQAQLAAEGFDVRPVEGYRSPERQAALLASGSGVTSVGAFSSCHNFGLALDAAVFINGEPSSEVLARALAPAWCPAGMETACLAWGNENRMAWNWFAPARVCFATFPNTLKKIG